MTTSTATGRPRPLQRAAVGRWARFAVIVAITAITLSPLENTVSGALGLNRLHGQGAAPGAAPGAAAGTGALTFTQWAIGLGQSLKFTLTGPALTWFENSLALALGTVVVCVVIGAPAGYVLARGRSRAVSIYALVIFLLQSFPGVLMLIPLFLLFAKVQLIDDLFGLGLVYLGLSLSVAVWMFSAYIATVPIELEEAAWLDGCSVIGAFFRVVLRNSLPAILSTAIFVFLFVWNDYLAAFTFIRSNANYTAGIGLQAAGHSPLFAVLIAVPPVLIFALLNRYFSFGGVGGALSAS
ncbi:carbohydrate ABC transporter permease [Gryllotalpicola daejeonensis]|uniref:Carbohydrate ABC transporter permease n=1 Tax=Gryllotalpicola daejeonensis TaxID=993087 RepID=A0ABP7ZLS5_9MICO